MRDAGGRGGTLQGNVEWEQNYVARRRRSRRIREGEEEEKAGIYAKEKLPKKTNDDYSDDDDGCVQVTIQSNRHRHDELHTAVAERAPKLWAEEEEDGNIRLANNSGELN